MQDEVNEKTIALYIKTGKLTAQTLQKAMKAILSKGKKPVSYTHLLCRSSVFYIPLSLKYPIL